jgi:transcriptional regulator with XRE-family HTH domain
VAAQLGVNRDTILNWERGKTLPPIGFVPRIIRFLGYDPCPTPMTLAERLVAKRRQLGLSRKRIAARLDVDEGTLKRWERGIARPTGKRIEPVKEFLASDA